MARYPHHHILKLRKMKLQVRVRPAFAYDYHTPCTSSCSAFPLHITFHTHVKQQFLEPGCLTGSSPIIGECQRFGDHKTICQDAGVFFKVEEEKNSRAVVYTIHGFLGLKKSMRGRVFKEVMVFGRRYEKIKGLVVVLTIEHTCIGEKVAVHEAVEESYQESKSEAHEMGDISCLSIKSL